MSSAPRGLAPRAGLGPVLMKMGRAGPPFEPCRRPQAGKSRDPRSQNDDSSPRAQGVPVLGHAGRRKGKSEVPQALTARGLGRRVAVDWAWAALFPHAPLFCAMLGGPVVVHSRSPFIARAPTVLPPLELQLLFSTQSRTFPPSHRHGSDEEGKREETRASALPAAVGGPRRGLGQGQLGSGHYLQRMREDDGLARVPLLHRQDSHRGPVFCRRPVGGSGSSPF